MLRLYQQHNRQQTSKGNADSCSAFRHTKHMPGLRRNLVANHHLLASQLSGLNSPLNFNQPFARASAARAMPTHPPCHPHTHLTTHTPTHLVTHPPIHHTSMYRTPPPSPAGLQRTESSGWLSRMPSGSACVRTWSGGSVRQAGHATRRSRLGHACRCV